MSTQMDLNDYQTLLQNIYGEKNKERGGDNVYGYVVRNSGYFCKDLGRLDVAEKDVIDNFIKALSWLFSLATQFNFNILETFLKKYPGICPHCLEEQCVCLATDKEPWNPKLALQDKIGKRYEILIKKTPKQTVSLDTAIKNISTIFTVNKNLWKVNGPQRHIRKISEEVAEIHEAISNYRKSITENKEDNIAEAHSILASETVDVFAWIAGVWAILYPEKSLDTAFQKYYENGCPKCKAGKLKPCKCSLHGSSPTGLVDHEKITSLMNATRELYQNLDNSSQDKHEEGMKELESLYAHVMRTQHVINALPFVEHVTKLNKAMTQEENGNKLAGEKKYDVFISYSSRDKSEAEKLETFLSQKGFVVFMADKKIQPSEKWENTLKTALNNSKFLCLLATPRSLKSEWVIAEYSVAWANNMKILPILLNCDADDLPGLIKAHQAIDYHEMEKIVDVLKNDNNHKAKE